MASVHHEIEVSEAAARAYGQLLGVLRGKVQTHASRDGGLICELRPNRARPVFWRIQPDGAVVADSRYSFVGRAFFSTPLPQGF
jgi:hypothetical protein